MAENAVTSPIGSIASPVALFQGVNSVSGEGLSTAVEGESTAAGAESEVRGKVSIDITDLAESLGIDQSLSVGFGPLVSMDEKVRFFHTLNVTTTSVVLSVYSRKTLGSDSGRDFKLKEGIELDDPDAFVRKYGDSYVSSLTKGGEYIGLIHFYSQSKEDQSKLVAELSAGGIASMFAVNAETEGKIQAFLAETHVSYSFHQYASGCSSLVFPEPSQFIDFALKYPSRALDAPRVIAYATSGYEHVDPGLDSFFDDVAKNRAYFGGGEVSSGLTKKLVALVQIRSQIELIRNIYKRYHYDGDATLLVNQRAVAADIDAITDQMRQFSQMATREFPPLTLNSLANGSPVLMCSVSDGPLWGGGGGGPFDDIQEMVSNPTNYILRMLRIESVGLRGVGGRVHQLSVTYADSAGKSKQLSHGENGDDQGRLDLAESDCITQIQGRYQGRLNQVVFTVSGGRTISAGGPSGEPGESVFGPWSPPPGGIVMGFKGRCGTEIDCLRVVYATFSPAAWSVDSSPQ